MKDQRILFLANNASDFDLESVMGGGKDPVRSVTFYAATAGESVTVSVSTDGGSYVPMWEIPGGQTLTIESPPGYLQASTPTAMAVMVWGGY